MIEQTFKDIYDERLAKDAIINDRCGGHKEDYLILHCLLRKYKPKLFMEIGCHTGFGTSIIINALEKDAEVFSMDLPNGESYKSKQHPINNGNKRVGYECSMPFTLILADSRYWDYSTYPCSGYFVDGEHTYVNVLIETTNILEQLPKIIVWHDCDEKRVFDAVKEAMNDKPYDLYRVTDTRIAYALRNNI